MPTKCERKKYGPMNTTTTPLFYEQMGLHHLSSWNKYSKNLSPFVATEKIVLSKIFIQNEHSFIFNRKKVLKMKKGDTDNRDGKLELFGGYLDSNESPEEALLRELTEEDKSKILATYFAKSLRFEKELYYKVISGKKRQYFIFLMKLSQDEYNHFLVNFNKIKHEESYEAVSLPIFSLTLESNDHHGFTPKTKKIFKKIAKNYQQLEKNCR